MARVFTSVRKAYVLAAGCFALAIVGAILIAQEFDGLGGASVLYLSAMGEIKDPPKPKAYPKTYLSAMGIIPVEMGAKLTKPLEQSTSDISAGAPQPLSEVDSDEIDHADPDETLLDRSVPSLTSLLVLLHQELSLFSLHYLRPGLIRTGQDVLKSPILGRATCPRYKFMICSSMCNSSKVVPDHVCILETKATMEL